MQRRDRISAAVFGGLTLAALTAAPNPAEAQYVVSPPVSSGWSGYATPRTYTSYYYTPSYGSYYAPSYQTATPYRYVRPRRWARSWASQEYYWPTGRDVPVAKPWLTP
jgi:hypothetical protein